MKATSQDDNVNPFELEAQADELDAEADERRAQAHRLRAQAKRARAALPAAPASSPTKERDLTGPELDTAMGWSAAHRRRLKLTPSYFAGDEERSPRFHLDDVRQQLRDRGPKATKAEPKRVVDSVDVSDIASRVGLRAVGGR